MTYCVLSGGNGAHADLGPGSPRSGAGRPVPTSESCGVLASARTSCAAG